MNSDPDVNRMYAELPRYVRYWSVRYGVSKDDAVQEYELFKLLGDLKIGAIRTALHRQRTRTGELSLNLPAFFDGNETILDTLPAEKAADDHTFELVYKAFRYWIRAGILTRDHALAIYFHAIEDWSLSRIDRESGSGTGMARYYYINGIRLLQEEYAGRPRKQKRPRRAARYRTTTNQVRGENHPGAKLTAREALEIFTRYHAGGISQPALAREYNVSNATVWQIVRGNYWRHVTAKETLKNDSIPAE